MKSIRLEWVIYCGDGRCSARVMEILLMAGYAHVTSLRGGLMVWASAMDPNLLVI